MMLQMKFFLILISLMILYACSYVVNVQPPILQPPAVEKKPLTVGVLYSEALINQKCSVSKGYIAESWEIEIGPSSIKMFDLILEALFENVVKIDSMTSAFNKGLKNVIEIRLKNYNGCEVGWPIFGSTIVVEYEAKFYKIDTTPITSWEGKGLSKPGDSHGSCGNVGPPYSFFEKEYLATTTCIAMRMAAADFIVNLQKSINVYLEK